MSLMPIQWRYDPAVDAGTLSLRDLAQGEVLAGGVQVSLSGDGIFDLVVHLDQSDRVVDIEFFNVLSLLPDRFTTAGASEA